MLAAWRGEIFAEERDPAAPDPASLRDQQEQTEAETGPTVPYEVSILGLEEEERLEDLVRQSSQLLSLADKPPRTLGALQRRLEKDLERFATALRSEGYYDASLSHSIDAGDPARVTVSIDTGPLYLLSSYRISDEGPNRPAEAFEDRLQEIGLELGQRAHAPAIAAAQTKLLQALRRNGRPFAELRDRKVYVDHGLRSLAVELTVDSGPELALGAARFRGVETIQESYLRHLIAWDHGQLYDERLLDESERELMATELFESVAIETLPGEVQGGQLPAEVQVQERPQRSIGFLLEYDTLDGPGATARWQHRNLLGAGERLTLEAHGSLLEQSLTGRFRKPWFWGEPQTLLAEGALKREDTDAFNSKAITSYLGLERKWGENWTYSFGGSLEFERSTDARNTEARTFGLAGIPLSLAYDGSNSLLDPTKGQRFQVLATPYFATIEESFPFTVTEMTGATYHAIDEEQRYVFALRGRAGSIFGASVDDIPASKRFYAGGGGSVRGYAFQSIGPLDASNDPLGGRSVAEINAELRLRVSETIGVVPFLDGGMVSSDELFTGFGTFRWGAGLGLRYHTAVGPIRFDFAVPLNKRDSDDDFAFYVSLGQAF